MLPQQVNVIYLIDWKALLSYLGRWVKIKVFYKTFNLMNHQNTIIIHKNIQFLELCNEWKFFFALLEH
jgi:hypothetical protein